MREIIVELCTAGGCALCILIMWLLKATRVDVHIMGRILSYNPVRGCVGVLVGMCIIAIIRHVYLIIKKK